MTFRSILGLFHASANSRTVTAGLVLATLSCGVGDEVPEVISEPAGPHYEVTLQPQLPEPGSDRRMMWSPYGKKLPLADAEGGMETRILLGTEGTPQVALRLVKSPESAHFDRLFVDFDRDGAFGEGELLETTPTERNNKFWSSFDTVLEIPVTDPITGELTSNPYPLGFWYVEDPRVPEEEPVIRFSRHGWMEGTAILDGVEAVILVTEDAMDGVYDQADSWALASADSASNVLLAGHARSLQEHNWLYEQAYKVQDVDGSGRRLILVPFDPGITRVAEEEMNDHLKVDRDAPRSGRTVAFLHDFSEAEAQARSQGKPLFIDFETTWCGPCKIMDEWVYTADQVVDASQSVVAVKVDGDDFPELKDRFGVSGFPTMIILSAQGEESHRLSGYVNVAAMTEFLGGDGP